MTNEEAIKTITQMLDEFCNEDSWVQECKDAVDMAIEALKAQPKHDQNTMSKQPDLETLGVKTGETCVDAISRQDAIDMLESAQYSVDFCKEHGIDRSINMEMVRIRLNSLPSAQPDLGKYEYHYDHTDCIWYRPEARNRCPVTCAQYRDGWNDAMNYIFRDGKGYRPYKRGEQYGE